MSLGFKRLILFVQPVTRSDTHFSFNINIWKAYYMYIQPRKGEEVQGAYTFRNRRDL